MLRPLALACCLLSAPVFAQVPVVTYTIPAAGAISDVPYIEVGFVGVELDPATVTDAVRVFGRWSGPAAGQPVVSLEGPSGSTLRFNFENPFFAGELVTVSLSNALRSASGEAFAGYTFQFWVRPEPASMDLAEIDRQSTRRAGEGPIISYGAYGGDLNGDGWSDLAVPNEATHDLRVFLNDGTGGYGDFVVHPLPESLVPSTNEGGDFNGDGRVDLAVGNIGNDRVSVMLGDGTGGFLSETAYAADESVRGLCVLDLDLDGHDDLVTANRSASNVTVLMGNGDGTFEPPVVIETGSDGETACAVADANGDGFADVFIGALTSREIVVLLSDGEGGLSVSSALTIAAPPWMLAAGDIDGDGHADVAIAGAGTTNAAVVYGDGKGGLGDVDQFGGLGRFAVAVDLGDTDGDGDLDLLISNYSSRNFQLFENLGPQQWATPRSFDTVADGNGSCAVFHDFDNDGDLDITGVDEGADMIYFYANPGRASDAESIPAPTLDLAFFPNPARDEAVLRFENRAAGPVRVRVYDALGRLVAMPTNAVRGPGEQTIRWSMRDLPSGAYVVRLQTGAVVATRSFVVAR